MVLAGYPQNPGGRNGVPDRDLFVPKDEHCGIWHDPPNWQNSSSFGDNGTTASVSAFGDLVQMSQYMGYGRSGIFTLDDPMLPEPYFVCSRAEDLRYTSPRNFDWGTTETTEWARYRQSEDVWPGWPPKPKIKWVNWRWPRFEYSTQSTTGLSTSVTCQWFAHDNIVLQQLVFKKVKGEGGLPVAWVHLEQDALIREGDYLDPKYGFNEVWKKSSNYGESYNSMGAPCGCGWITLHYLDPKTSPPVPQEEERPNTGVDQTPDHGRHNPQESSPTERVVEEGTVPANATSDRKEEVIASEANSIPGKTAAQLPINDTTENTQIVLETEDVPYSVAIVRTVFVNGTAWNEERQNEKKQNKDKQSEEKQSEEKQSEEKIVDVHDSGLKHTFGHQEDESLEVVVAFKLIQLPKSQVEWQNFVISAEEADVNGLLKKETSQLWADSTGTGRSLYSLDLSLRNPNDTFKASSVAGKHDQEAHDYQQDTNPGALQHETQIATSSASAEVPIAPSDEFKPRPDSEMASNPALTGPHEVPVDTPAKFHIDYLSWRTLEHILSVCAVPLVAPRLFVKAQHQKPFDAEKTAIVLTCGDASGHRVCTSAS